MYLIKAIVIVWIGSLIINIISLLWMRFEKDSIILFFIPLFNIIYSVFAILELKDKISDLMLRNTSNEFYIKKYKGFFYIRKHSYYITYKEVTKLNYGDCYSDINGFLIPYDDMKLICFETKRDAIKFIERLESFEVLEKLNYC